MKRFLAPIVLAFVLGIPASLEAQDTPAEPQATDTTVEMPSKTDTSVKSEPTPLPGDQGTSAPTPTPVPQSATLQVAPTDEIHYPDQKAIFNPQKDTKTQDSKLQKTESKPAGSVSKPLWGSNPVPVTPNSTTPPSTTVSTKQPDLVSGWYIRLKIQGNDETAHAQADNFQKKIPAAKILLQAADTEGTWYLFAGPFSPESLGATLKTFDGVDAALVRK